MREGKEDTMDSFTKQYIATALWSSTGDDDEPLDRNYSPEDIDPETIKRMEEDCRKFQKQAGELITEENLLRSSDHDTWGSFGHDFWLTRNGHGCGFWDGDYAEPAATTLTKLSKGFGTFDLYIGDDGKVYGG